MSELWHEIFTRPGHATFGRLLDDVPLISAGLHDGINKVGDGNMVLPASFADFDDILFADPTTPANSSSSLVRVYSSADPTRPIFEWLPQDLLPQGNREDPTVSVGGLGVKAILGYARVEAFDWDGSDDFAPADPDWLYGGNSVVRNGSFEDQPFGIPNVGFEDGTREPWWPGALEGVSANAFIQTAIVDTGTYALEVMPLLPEGGVSTSFRIQPANFYTVTARIRGDSGTNYLIGASTTEGGVPVAGNSNMVVLEANPGGYEIQHAFVGTGAFQTVTLVFGSAGDQNSVQLSVRENETPIASASFYVDDVTVSGFGIGTDPWEPTAINTPGIPGPVSVFEASNAQASVGTWSLRMRAEPGHGAFQQINGVRSGVTYTAGVDVGFTDVTSAWGIEVRDAQGNILGQTGAVLAALPGAWTSLRITFTIPDFIPGAQGAVFLRVINFDPFGTPSREVFVDNAYFFQGQPPATVGKILGDLYDDAVTDHAPTRIVWEDEANPGTAYLLKDFSDTVDSAGNAWADPEISIRLTMRMSYSQVMAEFARMGYEYRIVPGATDGIWEWQAYNPGTMSVDYTALPGPAIQGGSNDVTRQLARFVPPSTETLVEGLDRITARQRDASLTAALGRIEGSILDREVPDMFAATQRVNEAVATALTSAQSYGYTLGGTLAEEPLTAYQLGDLLSIIDPPEVPVVSSRFVDVVATITPLDVTWNVQFGSTAIVNPDAAVANAVAGLLSEFKYPESFPRSDQPSVEVGGGGGMMTLSIAAANASDASKAKADFIVTAGATPVIQAAIDILYAAGGGTIWLSEGLFTIDSDVIVVGGSWTSPRPMILRGLGEATIVATVLVTNWVMRVAQDCEVKDFSPHVITN